VQIAAQAGARRRFAPHRLRHAHCGGDGTRRDPAGRPRALGELTPAESRVVELAAQGRSNKGIAGIVFVSVKTVELHLPHAYAKLGVRSRLQLAPRLSPPS
jgi:DNA-binding NarL/FixJ family response regulator